MPQLSATGNQVVQDLAQRHGCSTDAVAHMLNAVYFGNGSMAQFNHPEFGGAGQWMRGGMTMVSDLFNNQLKCKVDNLCNDIANELATYQRTSNAGSFQSQSQSGNYQAAGAVGSVNDLFVVDPATQWWPTDLGAPNAIGAQNNVAYAYFAGPRRLAVKTGGDVWLYDTLDHQIGGFSQQQGSGASITFNSQFGAVNLATLPVVSQNGVPAPMPPVNPQPKPQPQTVPDSPAGTAPLPDMPAGDSGGSSRQGQSSLASPPDGVPSEDIIATLDRLGGLREKGYISDDEFAAKKAELLGRL